MIPAVLLAVFLLFLFCVLYILPHNSCKIKSKELKNDFFFCLLFFVFSMQNPANKREIHCDGKLKSLFDGRDKINFLEVSKLLNAHFVKTNWYHQLLRTGRIKKLWVKTFEQSCSLVQDSVLCWHWLLPCFENELSWRLCVGHFV